MPPEASIACLFMSLQATSAQRTRTSRRGLWGGKETISENRLRTKSGLVRLRGISTSGNPAAQDRLGSQVQAAKERVLPLFLALPPSFLSSQQPSQNSQQEAKGPN